MDIHTEPKELEKIIEVITDSKLSTEFKDVLKESISMGIRCYMAEMELEEAREELKEYRIIKQQIRKQIERDNEIKEGGFLF